MSETLRDKFKWTQSSQDHIPALLDIQKEIASGKGTQDDYYFLTGSAVFYALNCYLEGDPKEAKSAAQLVIDTTLQYFYGDWRDRILTPEGRIDPAYWRKNSLWFDEVVRSLPFAAALGNWEAANRISRYPPDDAFPEADEAKGEVAYVRALICYIRDDQPSRIEWFLGKSDERVGKDVQLLSATLGMLVRREHQKFGDALLTYLDYYRKVEFELVLHKLVALHGTVLYHLGGKAGFHVALPPSLADHIIRFD